LINRLTLKIQYQLSDHIFVHTEKMKSELREDFGIREQAISVIPFGINNTAPNTDLTPTQAKHRLGVRDGEKSILFFGSIRPYKGLVGLVAAFERIAAQDANYRLIIAGEPKRGSEKYWDDIQKTISCNIQSGRVMQNIRYIPDEETELYFKAADVLVLPYTHIFQSGVLFLAYSFGLPVIATDVGSLRDELIEGWTGFLCKPGDPDDLAKTIEKYFESDLFKGLDARRQQIRDYANERHSWQTIGELTRNVYMGLLGQKS
jgi:glycosyltransferase involved in cell wall biosynthesis